MYINYPTTSNQIWAIIGLNFVLLIFGYIIGSFNTSIILSHRFKKDDVRNHYSQNAGATNSLRTYGKKFALAVYFIDFSKVVIPTLLFAILENHAFPSFASLYWMSPQIIGFGVIIGHCWPVFFKFKGGKGVACTSAFILVVNPILWIIAFITFFSVALNTRKVSLASLSTVIVITPLALVPWFTQGVVGHWLNFINHSDNIAYANLQPYWFISGVLFLISAIIIVALHHTNIKRLIQGTESKISLKN
ncbi:glycerol-3-phosphate 1-O-acyltransferase [Mycoplasmopsis mucosicanis]|uniref:Glycerol-3-phosphate acyltransferase n=1 Tax=Mycoplasmopsis mucosicanis TaxID=458208 RepID=A0A507SHU3_9BACT|nr:glycerol-3-phosphate 1-O-acyltransferase PlsY [Mycoplasmopsis mucosicanis]TQC51419.1 glycerol-3-phosphate 1-O-acyltransferase [Mycoplasmopsis mucosicanis]